MRGQHAHRRPLGVRSVEQQQAVERDECQAVASVERKRREVGLDDLQAAWRPTMLTPVGCPGRSATRGPASPRPGGPCHARPVEHGGIVVHSGHGVPRTCQGHGQTTAAGGQLEDRPTRSLGHREVQVQVARIVGQVEVVVAGETGSDGVRSRCGHATRVDSRVGARGRHRQPATPTGANAAADREGTARDRRSAASVRDAMPLMVSRHASVGGHRGHLGVVVRRRHLHHVHAADIHAGGDPTHGAQQLTREHAARFGCAGARRHPRVDDVDVHRDVHHVGERRAPPRWRRRPRHRCPGPRSRPSGASACPARASSRRSRAAASSRATRPGPGPGRRWPPTR